MTNEEILRGIRATKKQLITVKKRQPKFCRYLTRKEGLKNLRLTRHIENKKDRKAANK